MPGIYTSVWFLLQNNKENENLQSYPPNGKNRYEKIRRPSYRFFPIQAPQNHPCLYVEKASLPELKPHTEPSARHLCSQQVAEIAVKKVICLYKYSPAHRPDGIAQTKIAE